MKFLLRKAIEWVHFEINKLSGKIIDEKKYILAH